MANKLPSSSKLCVALTKSTGFARQCPFGTTAIGHHYFCNAHRSAVEHNPDHPVIAQFAEYRTELLNLFGIDKVARADVGISKPIEPTAPPSPPVKSHASGVDDRPWWIKHFHQLVGGGLLASMALISEQTFLRNFDIDLSLFIFDVKSVSMFLRNVGYLMFFAMFLVLLPIALIMASMTCYRFARLSWKTGRRLIRRRNSAQFERHMVHNRIERLRSSVLWRVSSLKIARQISFLGSYIDKLIEKRHGTLEALEKRRAELDAKLKPSTKVVSSFSLIRKRLLIEFLRTIRFVKRLNRHWFAPYAWTSVLIAGLALGVFLRHYNGDLMVDCAKHRLKNPSGDFGQFCTTHALSSSKGYARRIDARASSVQTIRRGIVGGSVEIQPEGRSTQMSSVAAIAMWFVKPFVFLGGQLFRIGDADARGREFARWAHGQFIWEHLVRRGGDVTVVMKRGRGHSLAVVSSAFGPDCERVGLGKSIGALDLVGASRSSFSSLTPPFTLADRCSFYVHDISAPMLHLGEYGRWNFFYTLGKDGRALMIDQDDIAMISHAPLKFHAGGKAPPANINNDVVVYHDIKNRAAFLQSLAEVLDKLKEQITVPVSLDLPIEVRQAITKFGDALTEPPKMPLKQAKFVTKSGAEETTVSDATSDPTPKGTLLRRFDGFKSAIDQLSASVRGIKDLDDFDDRDAAKLSAALNKISDQGLAKTTALVTALGKISQNLPKSIEPKELAQLLKEFTNAIAGLKAVEVMIGTKDAGKLPVELHGLDISALRKIADDIADLNGRGRKPRVASHNDVAELSNKLAGEIRRLDTHPESGPANTSIVSNKITALTQGVKEIHTWPRDPEESRLLKAINGMGTSKNGAVNLPAHLVGMIGRVPERCKNSSPIDFTAKLEFASNKHKWAANFEKWMKEVVTRLSKRSTYPIKTDGALVILEGTADSSGPPQYNHWISEQRATTAYRALSNKLAVIRSNSKIRNIHLAAFGSGEWEHFSDGAEKNGKFVPRSVLVRICPFDKNGNFAGKKPKDPASTESTKVELGHNAN